MAGVHEIGHAGEGADLGDGVGEVVVVGGGTVFPEPGGAGVIGEVAVFPDAGEVGALQQAVVLQEADEDAAQHPADGGLGQLSIPPDDVGESGALGVLGELVLRLEPGIERRDVLALLAEIVLKAGDPAFEIGEEGGGVDHGVKAEMLKTEMLKGREVPSEQ